MKKYILFMLIILIFPCMVYAGGSDDDKVTPSTNINNAAEGEVITQTCESLLGSPKTDGSPAFYLTITFNTMKYIAIIVLIVTSSMDFLGAVTSQDNDMIKKVVSKMMKRAIFCAVIFLLPTVIEFTLQMVHNRSITTCEIGI
ncbi:MAG: hypothetical protein IJN13_05915 [Bacilli bacterium]|nr:hypothetical protein [Bacilli bacterium]